MLQLFKHRMLLDTLILSFLLLIHILLVAPLTVSSILAKNMFTMEEKVKIFAKIKAQDMSAVEIVTVYGVSRATAYSWKSLVQTN